jgi:linear primary-alkylsulfatase
MESFGMQPVRLINVYRAKDQVDWREAMQTIRRTTSVLNFALLTPTATLPKKASVCLLAALLYAGSIAAQSVPDAAKPKPAAAATKAWNEKIRQALPFADKEDFELASRGFIAAPKTLTIRNASGHIVGDMESFTFISDATPAPDTANPSLWRNAQLNMHYRLCKVIDRIYQVRGYDLSNITFVQGDTGWVVFDPLISLETAKAAYNLVSENLGKRPVVAVVYSHSHIDHFGGAPGVVSRADVADGKAQVIAPEHFTEHAISENVMAGNAMGRRAIFMYGALLPRGAQGGVNTGLGQTTSTGAAGLILPTITITRTGQEVTIDGVTMVFQMTPGTEAPAEMNTYFPQFKALWMAENATNTLHNLYTLRGAQVRDALQWSKYLDETIEFYGKDAIVTFQSHHWPHWETTKINDYLKKVRDLYKYIHDQSLRLLNQGHTSTEIAEALAGHLPADLSHVWYNRGYYGTVAHNAKAVSQRYLGWYDGNPGNLAPLPPEDGAKKYLEFMGGADAVIRRARADFDKGEYRWVAEVVKHVVFADPANQEAKYLLADAFEQLGYQAEASPWRSVYLQGAFELRNGVPTAGGTRTSGVDIIRAMPPSMVFDYLSIRLNGPKAAGKKIALNFILSDRNEKYLLAVENSVLHHWKGKQLPHADATLTLTKDILDAVQLGQASLDQKIATGEVKIAGNRQALADFLGLLDTFNFWFNIVTP